MKPHRFKNLPAGIRVEWSRANQAYFVMWHDDVLRVVRTPEEVDDILRDLQVASGEDLGDITPKVDLKQLRWMGDKTDVNPFFTRPWCVSFASGPHALAVSRHGYVAVATDSCPFEPPPERASGYPEKFTKIYVDYIERDISKSRSDALHRPLAALKKWAGPHGSGQWGTGKFRGGQIKGVHLNLELLSRVLSPFRGGEIEIVVGGELDPIRIYGDGWAASLMPRRDGETPDEPSFEGLGPGQRVMFRGR